MTYTLYDIVLQYVSTLEAQLSEAAQKNNALIKENEALRTKVKLLEKEVRTSDKISIQIVDLEIP